MDYFIFFIAFVSFYVFSLRVEINNKEIHYHGRFAKSNESNTFDWSGSEIEFGCKGKKIGFFLEDENGQNIFSLFVDKLGSKKTNNPMYIFKLEKGDQYYEFEIKNYLEEEKYDVRLFKRTEAEFGYSKFKGLEIEELIPINETETNRFLFLGDSLTTGYGSAGVPPCDYSPETEDCYGNYAKIVSRNFNALSNLICFEGRGLVRNYNEKAGTSEKPLPFYFNRTCALADCGYWNYNEFLPNAIFIYLGSNDFSDRDPPGPPLTQLRKATKHYRPTREEYMHGYRLLLQKLLYYYDYNPTFYLLCSLYWYETDPWCGYVYDIVSEYKKKIPTLNINFINMEIKNFSEFGCELHPNYKGHQQMADLIIPIVQKTLKKH